MIGLTTRQQQVVDIITETARQGLQPPSYRELADAMGISLECAYVHAAGCVTKGVLVRLETSKVRNLRLADRCPTCGADWGKVNVTVETEV